MSRTTHPERHSISRIGWLRAAVLGANDGIVSTGSLIVGIAAAEVARSEVFLSGVAALVAGAMSMAAGEYVSVSSQSDTERADLAKEAAEIAVRPDFERQELTDLYIRRGLDPKTAQDAAEQMMARDALDAHARDELGISDTTTAQPLQAALASALTFTAGAIMPLLAVILAPSAFLIPAVAAISLCCLVVLGMMGAVAGGAPVGRSVFRVAFWGALAMALTAGVGRLFGTTAG